MAKERARALAEPELAALSFEDFFREESLRLGKALYLITADAGEAEDLVQEAMARVYERWDRVRAMESPAAYVFRTALNLHRRRERRRRLFGREPGPEPATADPASAAASRVDVVNALRELTREHRETLVLVEWVGLTSEEAGRILGIEPGSVRARLHRARTLLRERLGGPDE
jgi:RNA polymerase sigma-70 factor (ECF subfamily)